VTKRRIGDLKWHPKHAVFRRDDGTIWMRVSREYMAQVTKDSIPNTWVMTNTSRRIGKNPDELVDVIDE